jgi:DnaJ like chaperone protein
MGWFGKVVGGTIGFALGGPLGAIAGAAFGHAFDKSEQQTADGIGHTLLSTEETAQYTFFLAAFSMLAKLTRVDGRVTQDEIDSIERFMVNELHLDPRSRRIAIDIFNAALHSNESFEGFAHQFYGQFNRNQRLLELMIDILLRVSVADGTLNDSEERLISRAAEIFHFNEEEYFRLKSQYAHTPTRHYSVLECSPQDSNEQIKKRYRKLVMEYHPDRIIAKGLPEEFTKFAEQKFREIQEAYEAIKKERGFN